MLLPVNFLPIQNSEESEHEKKNDSIPDEELSLRLSESDEEETSDEEQGRMFIRNSRLNPEAEEFIVRRNDEEQTNVQQDLPQDTGSDGSISVDLEQEQQSIGSVESVTVVYTADPDILKQVMVKDFSKFNARKVSKSVQSKI